jgi:ribonucleoside-diphosphate reductase alpha chain
MSKQGYTYEYKTGCGKLFVTCNDVDGRLVQVFVRLGMAGGCAAAHMRAYGMLTSTLLEKGAAAADVVAALKGIGCHLGNCCVDAVARAVETHEATMRRTT